MSDDHLVTVYRTFSPAQAHVIRSRLETSGIQASVAHELASLSLEGYSMAAGGILVQVPSSQRDDARTLIEAADDSAEPSVPPLPPA